MLLFNFEAINALFQQNRLATERLRQNEDEEQRQARYMVESIQKLKSFFSSEKRNSNSST